MNYFKKILIASFAIIAAEIALTAHIKATNEKVMSPGPVLCYEDNDGVKNPAYFAEDIQTATKICDWYRKNRGKPQNGRKLEFPLRYITYKLPVYILEHPSAYNLNLTKIRIYDFDEEGHWTNFVDAYVCSETVHSASK